LKIAGPQNQGMIPNSQIQPAPGGAPSDVNVGLLLGKSSKCSKPPTSVYIYIWKITMLSMGKSTISTGPFSMSQTVNVYQNLYPILVGGASNHHLEK